MKKFEVSNDSNCSVVIANSKEEARQSFIEQTGYVFDEDNPIYVDEIVTVRSDEGESYEGVYNEEENEVGITFMSKYSNGHIEEDHEHFSVRTYAGSKYIFVHDRDSRKFWFVE